MELTYERFDPPRPLSQYVGSAGNELGGLALSPMAFEALAAAKTSDLPCELVVIGAWIDPTGRRYLDYGATTAFIEATTDWRYDRGRERLRLVCQVCQMKDGKHTKSCDR